MLDSHVLSALWLHSSRQLAAFYWTSKAIAELDYLMKYIEIQKIKLNYTLIVIFAYYHALIEISISSEAGVEAESVQE